MAFKKVYKGIFTNSQVDYTDNSDNGQDVYVNIYDKEHEAANNAYDLTFSAVEDNTQSFITINIAIGADTSNLSQVEVQYSDDGGATWQSGLTQASPVQGTTYTNLITYVSGAQYLVVFSLISPPEQELVYIQDDIVIDIEMAGSPVTINVVDTNEDKFTVIRGKAVDVNVLSSNEVNISTFSDGGDNNFQVDIAVGDEANIVFTGWLSMSDISQALQVHPNVLRLTATDGLGFLKEEPLTDIDGTFFNKENKLIDYIAACLSKTGLSLDIICEMNVREETAVGDAGHFYNFCYVHAGTFERSPEEFEDCAEVLNKILGEMCYISQQKGQWFIKRIDEYDVQDCKRYKYLHDGTAVGYLSEVRFDKQIGSDNSQYTLAFMNDDAEIVVNRPLKEVKHTFNYNTLEVPCNGTFTRGAETGTLPDEVIDGITYSVKKFALDCWNNYEDSDPPNHQVASSNGYFIKRWYDVKGYQKFADVVVNSPLSVAGASRLEHEAIPMGKSDYFNLNYNFKWSSNVSGGVATNFLQCHIRLNGSDGSVWFYDDNDSAWHISDNVWTGIRTISKYWTPNDIDEAEWQSLSVDVGKIPVGGDITVAIYWGNFPESIGLDLHIQDFTIDYFPLVNGSYISIAGQEHKSEQGGNYLGKREKEVFISDCPKMVFKGALKKLVSGDYVPVEYFYNAAVFPTVPADEYLHPYGQLQNQDVWNQYNRTTISIDGTIDGVDSDKTDGDGVVDMPDIRHTYLLMDNHPAINNKHFALLHYRQDLDLCEQDMYLTEVIDTTVAKQYTGHSFKYLAND